jgi:hypothetical protein
MLPLNPLRHSNSECGWATVATIGDRGKLLIMAKAWPGAQRWRHVRNCCLCYLRYVRLARLSCLWYNSCGRESFVQSPLHIRPDRETT